MKIGHVLVASAFGSWSLLASANLVANGSFESSNVAVPAGGALIGTNLPGWTTIGGTDVAILANGNIYNLGASDGTNFLDLAGFSNAGFPKGITQTVNGLTPGDVYEIDADVGIRNGACVSGGSNCMGPVQVSVGIGGVNQTFIHDSALPGNIWGSYGFQFTAGAASETLVIEGLSLPRGQQYIGLDNVVLELVKPGGSAPEPSTLWLVGLAAFPLALRRRRASAATRALGHDPAMPDRACVSGRRCAP